MIGRVCVLHPGAADGRALSIARRALEEIMMVTELMGTGGMARLVSASAGTHVQGWHIDRCIARGLLAEPARVGRNRCYTADDLPRVVAALRAAGYLPKQESVAAS